MNNITTQPGNLSIWLAGMILVAGVLSLFVFSAGCEFGVDENETMVVSGEGNNSNGLRSTSLESVRISPRNSGSECSINSLDDTANIQNAINIARTVLLAPGTFCIKPPANKMQVFILASDLTIKGATSVPESHRLKVMRNPGDYRTIFGTNETNDMTGVVNVTLAGFTIDQNINNSTVFNACTSIPCPELSIPTLRTQKVIQLKNFSNITIRDMRFNPIYTKNAVYIVDTTIARDSQFVNIVNNQFNFETLAATWYDSSAVYVECASHTIAHNTFHARMGSTAIGGLETHRGPSEVHHNYIDGFNTGIHVASIGSGTTQTIRSTRINVYENTIVNAGFGIRLWSFAGASLDDVVIRNNVMELNPYGQSPAFSGAIGIGIKFDQPGDYKRLSITKNIIRFVSSTNFVTNYQTSAGIGITPAGTLDSATIAENQIINPPYVGILLGHITATTQKSKNVNILANRISNAGRSLDMRSENTKVRRAYFKLNATLDTVLIKDNILTESCAQWIDRSIIPIGNYWLHSTPANAVNVNYGFNKHIVSQCFPSLQNGVSNGSGGYMAGTRIWTHDNSLTIDRTIPVVDPGESMPGTMVY